MIFEKKKTFFAKRKIYDKEMYIDIYSYVYFFEYVNNNIEISVLSLKIGYLMPARNYKA